MNVAATVPEEGDASDFVPLRRQSSFARRALQRIDIALCLRIQPYGEEGGVFALAFSDLSCLCAQLQKPRGDPVGGCTDPRRRRRGSLLQGLRKLASFRLRPRRGVGCRGERCAHEDTGLCGAPARTNQCCIARLEH